MLLLDIEGTTTSVDFVYQTLFPYARNYLRKFLERHFGSEELRADIERLRQEHAEDCNKASNNVSTGSSNQDTPPAWPGKPGEFQRELEIKSIAAYMEWLMDRDRKSTGLKSLQGKIWEAGYRTGELRSHIYPDVLPAFMRWRRKHKDICIYSSGSIQAQKLLFEHTIDGDLRSFIRTYFDTTTGVKNHPASYMRIAQSLAVAISAVLFISDSIAEVDAAKLGGMTALLCARSGTSNSVVHGHAVIRTFDEVFP